jgi:SAM-dependent methyltransferase
VDLARRIGGPVLEIGCGTGRVLLPIARAGITIHGVDSSLPMLSILRQKIDREPPDVSERIRTHNGDMRNFRPEEKYPLVTIPFRPMQHMHSVEDQVCALTTAAFHLHEKGILAFDVFYPKFETLQARLGEEILEIDCTDPSTPNRIVRRYYRKDAVDKIQQIYTLTFLLRTYQGEDLIREECESLSLSYYTYPHLSAFPVNGTGSCGRVRLFQQGTARQQRDGHDLPAATQNIALTLAETPRRRLLAD